MLTEGCRNADAEHQVIANEWLSWNTQHVFKHFELFFFLVESFSFSFPFSTADTFPDRQQIVEIFRFLLFPCRNNDTSYCTSHMQYSDLQHIRDPQYILVYIFHKEQHQQHFHFQKHTSLSFFPSSVVLSDLSDKACILLRKACFFVLGMASLNLVIASDNEIRKKYSVITSKSSISMIKKIHFHHLLLYIQINISTIEEASYFLIWNAYIPNVYCLNANSFLLTVIAPGCLVQ